MGLVRRDETRKQAFRAGPLIVMCRPKYWAAGAIRPTAYYRFSVGFFRWDSRVTGGERGIRTLEGLLTLTPLAGVRLRPLGHLSVDKLDAQSVSYSMTPPSEMAAVFVIILKQAEESKERGRACA